MRWLDFKRHGLRLVRSRSIDISRFGRARIVGPARLLLVGFILIRSTPECHSDQPHYNYVKGLSHFAKIKSYVSQTHSLHDQWNLTAMADGTQPAVHPLTGTVVEL